MNGRPSNRCCRTSRAALGVQMTVACSLPSPDAAASTASRPASVTIAIHPCVGREGGSYGSDLGQARNEIFLQERLDRKMVICPWGNQIESVQQFPLGVSAQSA